MKTINRVKPVEYTDAYGTAHSHEKEHFKLFDFFANCEYFEEKFNYDEVLELPVIQSGTGQGDGGIDVDEIEIFDPDKVKTLTQTPIGLEGMRIDREFFDKAQETIQQDEEVKQAVENEQWEKAVAAVREKYENKPELYLTLEKIRKSENLDRRLTWREFLERVFGFISCFKSKDEKLEEECEKFISIHKPESRYVPYIKNYLKAYVSDEQFRQIINNQRYGYLDFYPAFTKDEFRALNGWRDIVP